MNNNQSIINAIIASSGGKINREAAQKAVEGDSSALLKGLSQEDRRALEKILADKTATQKILSSDAARELIKMLGKKG